MTNPLVRFAFALAGWLAACFLTWCLMWPWIARAVGPLATGVLDAIAPALATGWWHRGDEMTFTLGLAAGREALVPVRWPLHGAGVPLLWALHFATPAATRWTRLLAGTALLVAVQSVGVAFEALVAAGSLGLVTWESLRLSREALALGYQATTLLLPTLVPCGLWLAAGRGEPAMLVGGSDHGPAEPRP